MNQSPLIRCAFCSRVTFKPAAYIGNHPVGPTCAKRHNLGDAIRESRGAVRPASGPHATTSRAYRDAKTRDLFEDVDLS